ncbi:MAG: hypothetical protein HY840_08790 [Bacteroidetes bacterium]|nr:hypothetical protein [Bacteroidota bacterium]
MSEEKDIEKEKIELEKEKLKREIRDLKYNWYAREWRAPKTTFSFLTFLVVIVSTFYAIKSDFFKIEEKRLENEKSELRDTIGRYHAIITHDKIEIKNLKESMNDLKNNLDRVKKATSYYAEIENVIKQKKMQAESMTEEILKLNKENNQYKDEIEKLLRGKLRTPTVNTLTASNITRTSVALNGSVNPNGSPASAWFEFNANNVGTQNALKGISDILMTYILTGLAPNTNYSFRMTAVNANGATIGKVITFKTLE